MPRDVGVGASLLQGIQKLTRRTCKGTAIQRDVDRLSAFSDGVFAIAITLLVLSIEVPDFDRVSFGDAWDDLYPQLLSYGLSFVVIGVYWKAHHRMFRTLRRVTNRLLNLNLLLLGLVALIPFPTEMLGNSGGSWGGSGGAGRGGTGAAFFLASAVSMRSDCAASTWISSTRPPPSASLSTTR